MSQETKQENSKPLLTPDEFWHALGGAIGRTSLRQAIKDGRVRHLRVGNRYLVPRSEIENFPEREAQ